MSLWSNIAHRLKEMLKAMIGSRTIEQTLHVAPVISSQMENAIELWSQMYRNEAPWIHEPMPNDPSRVVSLGLPALIASEKSRMALIEFNSEITTPTKEVEVENPDYKEPQEDDFGNLIPTMEPKMITQDKPETSTDRAEYLEKQYKKLKKVLRKQVEYGIAKGGLVIKPYVVQNKTLKGDTTYEIEFDFIQADCFYPLAFDASGKITEAAFVETKVDKDFTYRRLEYHKWENNTVTIKNKAFRSPTNNAGDLNGLDLGKEVPLSEVPEWKDLKETAMIKDVEKPLYSYFKMPEANTIDTTSPLGVSGYSRARSLIQDADMQYSRLLWEYEAGEMALDIDRDALMFMEGGTDRNGNRIQGHSVLGHLQQRLYRKLDLGTEGDTYQPWAPALRDNSYLQGLNTILMRIEDVCGISRGTLSDATQEAKTATELKILKQRSYQTNVDIQEALEDCLRDTIYAMNVYCTLYKITPEGKYDVNFEWDDSIIVDVDMELTKRITLMQNGLTSKKEVRMWYFGETERQAEEALMQIDKENAQEMEDELAMESNRANMGLKPSNNNFGKDKNKPINKNSKGGNKQ